jgi:hypothetical protein
MCFRRCVGDISLLTSIYLVVMFRWCRNYKSLRSCRNPELCDLYSGLHLSGSLRSSLNEIAVDGIFFFFFFFFC